MNDRNVQSTLKYLSGFGSHHETEALAGALPVGRNSPQKVPHGLYAEQLSGSAFTAPRAQNLRSWLYRLRPAAMQGAFRRLEASRVRTAPDAQSRPTPQRLRWLPQDIPAAPTDFIDGLVTFATNGTAREQKGCGVHLYQCNRSMAQRVFYDADGELLLVPQEGALRLRTELGVLEVAPGEIAVVPRGVRFAVEVAGPARGYLCENYAAPFRLPELGPIGANGLANARDFLAPVAAYETLAQPTELVAKFGGHLWSAPLGHSPLDVVAWHGNYYPYKYDLARFNAINTVSYDHPDPSIFTVLTSPSDTPGTANVDFVIFPPRWLVAEATFRPPYFHRNVMSEFMGLVHGEYDAKQGGFLPGGASLHNCMSAHGPDKASYEKAIAAPQAPVKLERTLAFMFESRYVFEPTAAAMDSATLDRSYEDAWSGFTLSPTIDPHPSPSPKAEAEQRGGRA